MLLLPKPQNLPTHPSQAVLDFKGGESAALARLKYYLWDSNLIATYFDTRNGMLGELATQRGEGGTRDA
jgi:deoxyribodipyrimidine photo-lyase